MRNGRLLLVLSIFTRTGVIAILCLLAMLTSYHNLKRAYNLPRLVELSEGKNMRVFYETADHFFSRFGDPATTAQKSGGMTWSIRLGGVPFTDPIAAISVLAKSHKWELGFALGLIIPLTLALLFGRVFCSYICPASLLFFTISRIRRVISKFFLLPELSLGRGFCWGILFGGTVTAVWIGHGVWTLILPYFAIGQTLFHGIAYGAISFSLGSIAVFGLLDLIMGKQFTCRYICPTGRLLGAVGTKSVFALRRDADDCLDACTSCIDVCPMKVQPKFDETLDCSMCGECLTICPTKCLSIGLRINNKKKKEAAA